MCLGSLPVPKCARAPFKCPFVPGYHSSIHMFLDSVSVPICSRATFRCPYVPSTSPVPVCARAPFWNPYVPGHPYFANMCPDTYLAWSLSCDNQSPCTLPIVHVSLVTFPLPKCAQSRFRCLYVPGHHSISDVYLDTNAVLISDRTPFWCPSMPGQPSCAI